MNAYRIEPLKYPWPTLIYLLAAGAAAGLQHVLAFYLSDFGSLTLAMLGFVTAIAGIYLVVSAAVMLYLNRSSLFARRSPGRLVIHGPFKFSRHPMYLGYTLLLVGAGLFLDNGWMLVAAVIAAVLTHVCVIRKEEMHLLARFGYEFERYCRRTRAWI